MYLRLSALWLGEMHSLKFNNAKYKPILASIYRAAIDLRWQRKLSDDSNRLPSYQHTRWLAELTELCSSRMRSYVVGVRLVVCFILLCSMRSSRSLSSVDVVHGTRADARETEPCVHKTRATYAFIVWNIFILHNSLTKTSKNWRFNFLDFSFHGGNSIHY